jgi:DNA-binding protein HU-beta
MQTVIIDSCADRAGRKEENQVKGVILMNKTELIAAMAERAEISRKDAEAALKAFVETVSDALKNDDKVQIVGFGTFEVVERGEREGRNPLTGESMTIKASRNPKFKAGKALKDALNEG